jgi:hypothetical protein
MKHRHQHRRGQPLPDGYRLVARPSRWGNPWKIGGATGVAYQGNVTEFEITRAMSLACYKAYARACLEADPTWLDPLRDAVGLACYCPLTEHCHADVLAMMLKWSFPLRAPGGLKAMGET